jgi:NADP-dependent 3-hydroxy acid dehydrogenase YdfG/acyl carrier protein
VLCPPLSPHLALSDPQALSRHLLSHLRLLPGPCLGLLHLWSLTPPTSAPEPSLAWEASCGCGSVLACLPLLSLPSLSSARLWLVTSGSQALPLPSSTPPTLLSSSLWGLGRVLSLEHPAHWGGLIDLDPSSSPSQAATHLLSELLAPLPSPSSTPRDTQIVWRADQRFLPRLQRLPLPSSIPAPSLHPQACYLISGAFGGLGLHLASWLVAHGARSLLLLGRRPPSTQAQHVLQHLQAQGAHLHLLFVDVADFSALQHALAQEATNLPPLRGVFHAAGVLADGLLLHQQWDHFALALRPKILGAWNLHVLTQEQNLDFFVLYSSVAGVLGSVGQGNYAAANAFLDALAHYRRAQGLPGLSIDWGAWNQIGAAAQEQVQERVRRQGLGMLEPAQGSQALETLLPLSLPQVIVSTLNWFSLTEQSPEVIEQPLLADIVHEYRAKGNAEHAKKLHDDFLQQLEAAPSAERRSLLLSHVREQIIRVMRLEPSFSLEPRQGLFQIGMDSLMAVELSRHLQNSLGKALPATIAFDYPTLEKLTAYLASEVLSLDQPPSAKSPEEKDLEDHGEIADVLEELEQLSEDDAANLLLHDS